MIGEDPRGGGDSTWLYYFHQPLLRWLQRVGAPPKAFANNPIRIRRQELRWQIGEPKNSFRIMRESIERFFDQGFARYGVRLMQSYAEHMYWASKADQHHNQFNINTWMQKQHELIQSHLNVDRRADAF